jgi:hypothetical protein
MYFVILDSELNAVMMGPVEPPARTHTGARVLKARGAWGWTLYVTDGDCPVTTIQEYAEKQREEDEMRTVLDAQSANVPPRDEDNE